MYKGVGIKWHFIVSIWLIMDFNLLFFLRVELVSPFVKISSSLTLYYMVFQKSKRSAGFLNCTHGIIPYCYCGNHNNLLVTLLWIVLVNWYDHHKIRLGENRITLILQVVAQTVCHQHNQQKKSQWFNRLHLVWSAFCILPQGHHFCLP